VVDAAALLDEAMPRNAIPPKAFARPLTQLADNNWKERKAGLEAVEELLEANAMRILPTGLKDLVKAMIGRLHDSNKAIIRVCLGTLGKLAEALGTHAKAYAKVVVPGLIPQLGDKQAMLR
jgi:cytoskeleton-associated protein 5